LEALEQALESAPQSIRVFDIVGEPGIGRSRLIHEFRTRIADRRAFVLSGSCTSDTIVRGPLGILYNISKQSDEAREVSRGRRAIADRPDAQALLTKIDAAAAVINVRSPRAAIAPSGTVTVTEHLGLRLQRE